MFEKANIICVPFSRNHDNPFPACYDGVITCSYLSDEDADYSINPVLEYRGNSFAVPAIARLLAYKIPIENNKLGINIIDLFSDYKRVKDESVNINRVVNLLSCPFCKNSLRSKYHTPLKEYPERCPYCGLKLK